MHQELSILLDPELDAFVRSEAASRGVSPADIGRFALELLFHYRSQVASANGVLLLPPGDGEAPRDVLYAMTIPAGTTANLVTEPGCEEPPTFRLSLSADESPPPLRIVR